MLGNHGISLDLAAFMKTIYRMSFFYFKNITHPLLAIFSIIKHGSMPSNYLKFPESDNESFHKKVIESQADFVIIQTTFAEISLYNLIGLLNINDIPYLVLVDSWDNIGSKPVIPLDIRKLLVHSPQQYEFAQVIYGFRQNQLQILGTPRIPKLEKLQDDLIGGTLRIGYLQGSPSDDLDMNLGTIFQLIKRLIDQENKFVDFEILIRKYPMKKENLDGLKKNLGLRYEQVVRFQPQSQSIDDFFSSSDFIISEITTAGLEAAYKGIRTLFIASNSKKTYMNGSRAMMSVHSHELQHRGFVVLRGLSHDEDYEKFKSSIECYAQPDLAYYAFTSESESITSRLIRAIESELIKS